MPIKGEDFVKLTDEEMEKLFSIPNQNCGICNKPIKHSENIQYIRDDRNPNEVQLTHEDCYFDKFYDESGSEFI